MVINQYFFYPFSHYLVLEEFSFYQMLNILTLLCQNIPNKEKILLAIILESHGEN